MEWRATAFVLGARAHGETGAIVDLLTASHGKISAYVAGGASRKLRPVLQPGARVEVAYRSRVSDQLGSATLESDGPGAAALFDDPLALLGLTAAAALVQAGLPDREPHSGIYYGFETLLAALIGLSLWPAVFVRFEAGLLEALGFGLDLSICAATGSTDDLVYISPRSGRAVSRSAGAPYRDRLLRLPGFLLSAQSSLDPGDVGAGLEITGHFLRMNVFNPVNQPLPPQRQRLIEALSRAGRL